MNGIFTAGPSTPAPYGSPGRINVYFGDEPPPVPPGGAGSPTVVLDASPELEQAVRLLAAGQHEDALAAAREACRLAPERPQPYYAAGQALLQLGRLEQAEQAFAGAIQRAPAWAEAWVNYGVARFRRNGLGDAVNAMREALRHAPGHTAAGANLTAFLRLAEQALANEAAKRAAAPSTAGTSVLRVTDSVQAMGLAVGYLMDKEAFARLPFQQWAHVLNGQIKRGHFRVFAGPDGRTCGFFGWSLVEEAAARAWLSGEVGLSSEQCTVGDCVIFNAWAADTGDVHRFMVEESRRLFAGKRAAYYKRYYPDGRVRLARLPGTAFVHRHVVRSEARATRDQADPSGATGTLSDID